jgi:hypothetical protein
MNILFFWFPAYWSQFCDIRSQFLASVTLSERGFVFNPADFDLSGFFVSQYQIFFCAREFRSTFFPIFLSGAQKRCE